MNNLYDFISILKLNNIEYIVFNKSAKVLKKNIIDRSEFSELINSIEIKKIINEDFVNNILYNERFTTFKLKNSIFIIIANKQIIYNYSNYIFLLQSIMNLSHESILIVDKNRNIIFTNSVFLKQYGFGNEIKNYLITELIPPVYLENIIKILDEDYSYNIKIEIYNVKGENYPVVLNSVKWGDKHILILEDLVEKEIVYKEIDGLKKMQKLIFDSMEQGIVVLDRSANIIEFNRYMEKEYKFNRKSMIGLNIFDIVPDLQSLGMHDLFYEIIEKKRVKKITEVKRFSQRLKKELYQSFFGYPLIDNDKVVGAVVLVEDLTRTKKIEKEYKLSKQQNEIINELNSILSKTIDLNKVLMFMSEYILNNFGFDKIQLFDEIHNSMYEYKIKNKELYHKLLKPDNEFIDKIKNITKDKIKIIETSTIHNLINLKTVKQIILIPIIHNSKKFGYFIFINKKQYEIKIQLLNILQEYSGYILDKTFLYEEKKNNLRKIEFVLKISKIISNAKINDNTYNQILYLIMDEIKAHNGLFLLISTNEKTFIPVTYKGNRAERFIKSKSINYDKLYDIFNKSQNTISNSIYDMEQITGDVFKKNNSHTIYGVLRYKNELLGLFIFLNPKTQSFEKEDIELVNIITSSISNYIKNIHLQLQMEEKIEQLSILYKISSSVKLVINYLFLKKVVVSSLGSLLKSDFVLLLKKEDRKYKIEQTYFRNLEYKQWILKSEYIKTNEFESIRNFKQFNEKSKLNYYSFKKKINSSIVFSIKNKKEHLYILIGFIDKLPIQINDETFYAIINEINIAFDNAILFDENEKNLKQFSSINSLIKRLTQPDIEDIEEYYNYVVNAAKELLNTEYASLLIKSGNILEFRAFAGIDIKRLKKYSIKVGEGIAGHVAETKESVIVNDVLKNKYYKKFPFSNLYKVKSLINVPLIYRDEVIGVICVDNKKDGKFNENDILLLKILANSTIIAFENFLNVEIGDRLSDVILNNIPSGVIYINHKGYVNYVNTGFINISNYNRDEVLNLHYKDIFTNAETVIENSIKYNKKILRKEVILIKKDGTNIPCGISITPVNEGKNVDVVAIIQDLSQIKKIRKELKEKENLALLGQTAAGMAHEIKNPLAGILTGLEFMHMKIDKKDETLSQSLELVIKEVKRLDRLVNDMTSFAKSKIKIISKINIVDLIHRALNLTKNKFTEKKIRIIKDIPDNIRSIEADEEQLLEVLINIILNANQAIEKKGMIKISVEQDKKYSHIKIFNDGPNIPGDIYDKIFNPFFTTKSGGTGLGLAISYNIIKEHKGTLKVNNLDNGVEFIISLPYKQEKENE